MIVNLGHDFKTCVQYIFIISECFKFSDTISTMGYNIRAAEESYGKPESMRYPFARYPSAKYPSPFPSSFPSLKYPKASAYPYGLPISALPYPSPFPTHFMDSRPIPSDMDHLANKLYSAPYLFALGSSHHLKVREELKSVVSTVDLARSINLPSPVDPCFSQKLTAFNAGKGSFWIEQSNYKVFLLYSEIIQQHTLAVSLTIFLAIARFIYNMWSLNSTVTL